MTRASNKHTTGNNKQSKAGWNLRTALEDAQWTHVATACGSRVRTRRRGGLGSSWLLVLGADEHVLIIAQPEAPSGQWHTQGTCSGSTQDSKGRRPSPSAFLGPLISLRVTPSLLVPFRQPTGPKNTEPHRPFCPGQLRQEPWGETAWILALPIPSCVTSNKSLNLSVPLFPSA